MNYYAKLQIKDAEYYYKTLYAGRASTLEMEMLGTEPVKYNGCETYSCYWKFGGANSRTIYWYYNLSRDSPLALNKTWSFTRPNGDELTAKVTKYGARVQIGDSTFTDVVEVRYTGADVTAVKWFARDVGLIYSHMESHGVVSEDILDYVEYP